MKTEPTIPSTSSVSPVSSVVKSFSLAQAETPAQLCPSPRTLPRIRAIPWLQRSASRISIRNSPAFPGGYAPPVVPPCCEARAADGWQVVGCVALHQLEPGICEMKRLYLRPIVRGKGFGRILADRIIAEARQIGHVRDAFSTPLKPVMKDARRQRKLETGFQRDRALLHNHPITGALYMELKL